MVPGVDNVSNPVLIKMAKHELIYPPTARRSKNQAQVILQALVNEDGWVGDIYVIRTNSENIDFVVSTKQTVSFWLYEPARQAGCPVAVYFTVVADFILHN